MKTGTKKTALLALYLITLAGNASAMEWMDTEQLTWNGSYLGINIGGAFNKSNVSTSTVFDPVNGYLLAQSNVQAVNAAGGQSISSKALPYGIQGGYNFNFDSFIMGLEVDFNLMNLRGSQSTTAAYPASAPATFTINQSVRTSYLFTARPRIGYSFGDFLFYGTGGYALTNLTYDEHFSDNLNFANETGHLSKNISGWTAGMGLEYLMGINWSIRLQYLYADFGNQSIISNNLTSQNGTGNGLLAFPTQAYFHQVNLKTNLVNLAINYLF